MFSKKTWKKTTKKSFRSDIFPFLTLPRFIKPSRPQPLIISASFLIDISAVTPLSRAAVFQPEYLSDDIPGYLPGDFGDLLRLDPRTVGKFGSDFFHLKTDCCPEQGIFDLDVGQLPPFF